MEFKKKDDSLTRRDFIKQSSSVMAGVGLAAFGAPAILSAQNVSSRINFAIIGTGSRGCTLLRAIAGHKEALVTDVCDIYPPHLAEGIKDSGNAKVSLQRGLAESYRTERCRCRDRGYAAPPPCPDERGCPGCRKARVQRKKHGLEHDAAQ